MSAHQSIKTPFGVSPFGSSPFLMVLSVVISLSLTTGCADPPIILSAGDVGVRDLEGRRGFGSTSNNSETSSVICGDGVCSQDINPNMCEVFLDGVCKDQETCETCPYDCGACTSISMCGDGVCTAQETCETCSYDCGVCPPVCGDNICGGDETCEQCPTDCGECAPVCGDNICEGDETCDQCPTDCGECPPICGDGECEEAESCDSCPNDCGVCDLWPEVLKNSEEEMLEMVNNLRAQGANCGGRQMSSVGPLTMNPMLRQAARLHSQDMGDNNYFSHNSLNGSDFSQRARAAGYDGFPGGENIAAGNMTAQATFEQWVNSAGHCQNMMQGNFNEIGVGHAESPNSDYRHYWTQVFGSR